MRQTAKEWSPKARARLAGVFEALEERWKAQAAEAATKVERSPPF